MRAGNFSPAYLSSISRKPPHRWSWLATSPCLPSDNRGTCNGLTFPNGIIPQSAMDPNALALLKLYPQAEHRPRHPRRLQLPVSRPEPAEPLGTDGEDRLLHQREDEADGLLRFPKGDRPASRSGLVGAQFLASVSVTAGGADDGQRRDGECHACVQPVADE